MNKPSRIGWLVLTPAFLLMAGCDRTVAKNEVAQSQSDSAETTGRADQLPSQRTDRTDLDEPVSSLTMSDGPADQVLSSASLMPQEQDGASSTSPENVQRRHIAVHPVKSNDPAEMIQHLGEIDRSIQDLLLTTRQMDEQAARDAAVQLSRMKLEAAEHLAHLPSASPEQSLVGLKAQLIALSHLSGLRDVASARQLEELAESLLQHPDSELRHQGQIVLFGFKIQNLQNGVLSDATRLVQSATEMLEDRRFRTRLEMTSLTHAINVLDQMGFSEEANQLVEVGFQAFSDSSDRELRYESWNQLTRQSRSVENFLASLQSNKASPANAGLVLAAARGMVQEHPNPVTIEMIAGVIPDVEYAGNLKLSTELSTLIDSESSEIPAGVSSEAIAGTLTEHRQRLSWLDRKLELVDLVDSDGNRLDLAAYEGKVVLIDFWATWCPPCLQEIPNLRQAHLDLSDRGFAILSINMDKEPARLNQFLQAQRLPWPTYRPADGDTKRLTDQFGITLFPHTLLMNRKGRIVGLHVRGSDVRSRAEQFLQEEL